MLTFTVPSSTGDHSYRVTLDPDHCSCKGFAYNGRCSHLRWVTWRVANGLRAEPGPVKKELIEHVR